MIAGAVAGGSGQEHDLGIATQGGPGQAGRNQGEGKEKSAKAAEETAKHTKRIAALAERGRLVFS